MARKPVTTHPHEGHLNPTFSISHHLVKQGHEVIYLNHPLIKKLIAQQGFPSVPFRFLRLGVSVCFGINTAWNIHRGWKKCATPSCCLPLDWWCRRAPPVNTRCLCG